MESVDRLESNLLSLLSRYKQLEAEVSALSKDKERLQKEIKESNAELVILQRQHRQLQTALSLVGKEGQRKKAYQEITYLIQLVEKAQEILK